MANKNDDNRASENFPAQVMSGLAGRFTEIYSSRLEVPAQFFYFTFLTCLGAILSKILTLASEIAPQPRLYVILLGESASERKSTAIKKTIDFFKYALEQDYIECLRACWGVGSAEGLLSRFKVHDRMLLCFDELKQFVGKSKIQASVLLPCVNTLFESNRYENALKDTYMRLRNAHLSFLAASTIRTYENIWDSTFLDIGFSNRLFIVPGTARPKFAIPEKIDTADKNILKKGLIDLIDHVGGFKMLKISGKARKSYEKWYLNLDRSVHAKRLDVYAMRLMCLLAVNDMKYLVDSETVAKVIALCDWQLQVRRLHDPIDADNKIARIEQAFRRHLAKGPKSDRELKQLTNAYRAGLWAYNTAKKNLQLADEIIIDARLKKWKLSL
jgi:hypothetical protein